MYLVHLLATDSLRSVMNDSTDVRRAYTAYGLVNIQGGPMSAFCGEYRDPLAGYYHLGNGYRQFNPAIMRFHGPDGLSPFGEGGLNAYMYCEADPVNRIDPSGKVPISLLQRLLTTTLHVVSPTALIFGPPPKGALAVNATRLALMGSTTTVAGAGLGFAGVAVAPYVSATGTGLLLAGGVTRIAKALWDNRSALWQNIKNNSRSNLRTIFKGRVEKKKNKTIPLNSPKRVSVQAVFMVENELTRTGSTVSASIATHTTENGANIRQAQRERPSL